MNRLTGLALAAFLIAMPARLVGQDTGQTDVLPHFEVASIKELPEGVLPPGIGVVGPHFTPGRFEAACANLRSLLYFAYQLSYSTPISGTPNWWSGSCGGAGAVFQIEATMDPAATIDQTRLMVQDLLAERFRLALHRETKVMPVFALVVASGGLKLKPWDEKVDGPYKMSSTLRCPQGERCHMRGGGPSTAASLAAMLSSNAGRPVIDKTGLTGEYNFDFVWADDSAVDSALPFLAAIREDFGLELKPDTGPVEEIVIDHVEKPTKN